MKKFFFFLSILILVLPAAGCEKKPSMRDKSAAEAGAEGLAHDFVLKDIAGKDLQLSSLKGKIVVLEFWASWCPPCKASIPELNAIQEKYRGKGVEVLGISIEEADNIGDKLAAFSKKHGITYPILIGNEQVQKNYHVISIPTTFLIGKEGKIEKIITGYTDSIEKQLSEDIERIR